MIPKLRNCSRPGCEAMGTRQYCSPICWKFMRAAERSVLPLLPRKCRPQPFRLIEVTEVHEYRRIYCKQYDGCLDYVLAKGWFGWSCKGCRGYEPVKPKVDAMLVSEANTEYE